MMIEFSIAVVLLLAALAMNSWPATLSLCTVMALVQDPLRKLVPGQPVYFVVLVGVVFVAGWLGAYSARVPLTPKSIVGWKENVGAPFSIFVFIGIVQAIHSFSLFGSPVMTGIGILSYFSPAPAIVFAYQFALRYGLPGVTRWMWTYVVLTTFALLGVYFEFIGMGWPVLGQVGVGMVIYDVGRALTAYAGFFRAAEVAAWHTSTVACMLIILMFGKKKSVPGLAASVLAVGCLLAIGTLTGRRKLLIQVGAFVCAYFGLFALFQRRSRKVAGVVGLMGTVLYLVLIGTSTPASGLGAFDSHGMVVADDEMYMAYALRTRSVVEGVWERIQELGVNFAFYAYQQWGFFGAGLGSASQGTQYFGSDALINRGAAEGGLGKIMLELGVPGFISVGWLLYAMARYAFRALDYTSARAPQHARVGFGLAAILTANAATFVAATQVYADVYILMTLGWSTGILLALPVLARAETAPSPASDIVGRRRRDPSNNLTSQTTEFNRASRCG